MSSTVTLAGNSTSFCCVLIACQSSTSLDFKSFGIAIEISGFESFSSVPSLDTLVSRRWRLRLIASSSAVLIFDGSFVELLLLPPLIPDDADVVGFTLDPLDRGASFVIISFDGVEDRDAESSLASLTKVIYY